MQNAFHIYKFVNEFGQRRDSGVGGGREKNRIFSHKQIILFALILNIIYGTMAYTRKL